MAKKKEEGLIKRATETALTPWEQAAAEEARNERANETVGVPRITHRGGVFKIDDRVVGNQIIVGVLGYKFEKQRYLKKFDPNKQGSTPDCYAFGEKEKGMVAHEQSRAWQNKKDKLDGEGKVIGQWSPCDDCPANQFNTAEVGTGKLCKDYRRLLVMSPVIGPDGKPKMDADSVVKAEPRLLLIPPASLGKWGIFYKSLTPMAEGGMGLTRTGNIREALIKITVSPLNQGGHGLDFELAGLLSEQAFQAVLARRKMVDQMLTQPYPNIESKDEEDEEDEAEEEEKRAKVRKKMK